MYYIVLCTREESLCTTYMYCALGRRDYVLYVLCTREEGLCYICTMC